MVAVFLISISTLPICHKCTDIKVTHMYVTSYVLITDCLYTGTDKPTMKFFNQYIRTRVAPHWYDFGVQILGDEFVHKLDVIKANHPNDVEGCCKEMFNYWIQVDPDASWNKLTDALEQIEHYALAVKVKKDILKGTSFN